MNFKPQSTALSRTTNFGRKTVEPPRVIRQTKYENPLPIRMQPATMPPEPEEENPFTMLPEPREENPFMGCNFSNSSEDPPQTKNLT